MSLRDEIELFLAIRRRRQDREFIERLREIVEREREVLDLLAENDKAEDERT